MDTGFPPVRSARIISAKAQYAARAWEQPVTPVNSSPSARISGARSGIPAAPCPVCRCTTRRIRHQPKAVPAVRRPGRAQHYIECAARALECAGRDITFALSDHITQRPAVFARAVGRGPASRGDATAYIIIERPSGSAAGRDVAVSAFMAAAVALDTAAENLAAHASAPMSAILARQRVRLEQAHIALRESLAASAAGKDVSGGLAAAQSMRERQPILSYRSRPAPDAPGGDATTLAIAGFPQPAPGQPARPSAARRAGAPTRLRVRARRPGMSGALL